MARAMWSGSISFGLVNIPIKLHSALRDRSIHFHMLSKDGQCRLRRKLVCPETGKEYDFDDTARGYEIAPDQYVLVDDIELKALKPDAGRSIDILDFVDLADIDPIYYDRPYYLAPDERGGKGYQLLLQAMKSAKKVGIAKFVMRGKEYLAALRPMGDVLSLATMHFAEEIIPVAEQVDLPEAVAVNKKELDVAQRLIDALEAEFEPKKYKDDYRDKVQELLDRKAEGKEIITQASVEEDAPEVYNLMEALEKSLQRAKKTSEPTAKASGGRKRRKSA